jgi:hypothetical protein
MSNEIFINKYGFYPPIRNFIINGRFVHDDFTLLSPYPMIISDVIKAK